MELNKAIDQISEIYNHLSKSEVFKGYRPFTVFFIGLISFLFAVIQSIIPINFTELQFIIQWICLAFLILVLIIGNITINYITSYKNHEKYKIKKILLQFLPCMLAGCIITIFFIFYDNNLLKYLPGLWALIFGMGIIAMRPYLPSSIIYVGFFYILAGCFLLYLTKYNLSLSPWGMGLTYSIGHFLSALILYIYIKGGNHE